MIRLIAFLFPMVAMGSTIKVDKLCLREGTNDSCLTITGTSADGNFTLDPDGEANQVLTNDGSGNWTWENASSGFANPMDSAGDLIYGGAGGAATKLDSGSSGQALISGGAGAPSWKGGVYYDTTIASAGASGGNTVSFGSHSATGTGVTNINSNSGIVIKWMRVGNILTGSISLTMNVSDTNNFELDVTLPSLGQGNFTASNECNGSITGENTNSGTSRNASIRANISSTSITIKSGVTDAPGNVIYRGSFVCELQ